MVIRSNAGPDPSPRLSKQLCFRSQGSLANKLTGEADGGDVDTQLTKMDVVLTFQIEVTFKDDEKRNVFSKILMGLLHFQSYMFFNGNSLDQDCIVFDVTLLY